MRKFFLLSLFAWLFLLPCTVSHASAADYYFKGFEYAYVKCGETIVNEDCFTDYVIVDSVKPDEENPDEDCYMVKVMSAKGKKVKKTRWEKYKFDYAERKAYVQVGNKWQECPIDGRDPADELTTSYTAEVVYYIVYKHRFFSTHNGEYCAWDDDLYKALDISTKV